MFKAGAIELVIRLESDSGGLNCVVKGHGSVLYSAPSDVDLGENIEISDCLYVL